MIVKYVAISISTCFIIFFITLIFIACLRRKRKPKDYLALSNNEKRFRKVRIDTLDRNLLDDDSYKKYDYLRKNDASDPMNSDSEVTLDHYVSDIVMYPVPDVSHLSDSLYNPKKTKTVSKKSSKTYMLLSELAELYTPGSRDKLENVQLKDKYSCLKDFLPESKYRKKNLSSRNSSTLSIKESDHILESSIPTTIATLIQPLTATKSSDSKGKGKKRKRKDSKERIVETGDTKEMNVKKKKKLHRRILKCIFPRCIRKKKQKELGTGKEIGSSSSK